MFCFIKTIQHIRIHIKLYMICMSVICVQAWLWYPGLSQEVPTRTSHYNDVIMSAMASQITSVTSVNPAQIKENINTPRHWPLCGWPVNSLHEGPATRKMLPFDDVIMNIQGCHRKCQPKPCVLDTRDKYCASWNIQICFHKASL